MLVIFILRMPYLLLTFIIVNYLWRVDIFALLEKFLYKSMQHKR